MTRESLKSFRSRTKATEQSVDAAVAAVQAERDAEWQETRRQVAEADRVERERPKLTRDDLAGATAVRDQFGWHNVARVNKVSVSVRTPYSWTDKIPFEKILEARTPGAPA